MIKKKNGVDEQKAFEDACKINGIELTLSGSNKNPVAYIDYTGKKRMLKNTKKKNANCLSNVTVGDYVRVIAKSPRKTKGSAFVGYVMEKDEQVGSISLRPKGRIAYAFQKSHLLKLDNVIKADIIKRNNASKKGRFREFL